MSPLEFLFRAVVTILCGLGTLNVVGFFIGYFRPDLLPSFYKVLTGTAYRVHLELDEPETMAHPPPAFDLLDAKLRVCLAADSIDQDRIQVARKGLDAIENVEVVDAEEMGDGGADVFWLLRPEVLEEPAPWVELGYASALHKSGLMCIVTSGPRESGYGYTMTPPDWKEGDPPWLDVGQDDLGLAAVEGFAKSHASMLEIERNARKNAKGKP